MGTMSNSSRLIGQPASVLPLQPKPLVSRGAYHYLRNERFEYSPLLVNVSERLWLEARSRILGFTTQQTWRLE